VDRWLCVYGLFRVSGRFWVGGIRSDVGKFMCCVSLNGLGVLKGSLGRGWAEMETSEKTPTWKAARVV
jgi:hypothetical protein